VSKARQESAAQFITKSIDFHLLKAQLQPLSDAAD